MNEKFKGIYERLVRLVEKEESAYEQIEPIIKTEVTQLSVIYGEYESILKIESYSEENNKEILNVLERTEIALEGSFILGQVFYLLSGIIEMKREILVEKDTEKLKTLKEDIEVWKTELENMMKSLDEL